MTTLLSYLGSIIYIFTYINVGRSFVLLKQSIIKESLVIFVVATLFFLCSTIPNPYNLIVYLLFFTISLFSIFKYYPYVVSLGLGFLIFSCLQFFCLSLCNLVGIPFSLPILLTTTIICNLFFILLQIKNISFTLPIHEDFFKKSFIITIPLVFFTYLMLSDYSNFLTNFFIQSNLVSYPLLVATIILFLLSVFLIIITIQFQLKQKKLEAENQKLLHRYINEIKARRHDFNSHLSTILYLSKRQQHNELESYISSMISNYDIVDSAFHSHSPELSALLFHFNQLAKQQEIQFIISIKSTLNNLPITPYTFNRLISNLLTNAFEAAQDEPFPYVSIEVSESISKYIIQVENNGVNSEEFSNLSQPGISTKSKDNSDCDRGYGLYIIHEILNECNGSIHFNTDATNQTVSIITTLPKKGENSHE